MDESDAYAAVRDGKLKRKFDLLYKEAEAFDRRV